MRSLGLVLGLTISSISIFCAVACSPTEAAPCTTSTTIEGDVVVRCPDGTTSILKKDGGGATAPSTDAGGDTKGNDASTPNSDAGADVGAPPQHATLVRVEVEPIGANCAAGGKAIRKGADTNDNGVLDPAEIKDTSYVCSPTTGTTVSGDVTIKNSLDVTALAGVSKITGSLTIEANGLSDVALPSLVEVGGNFIIQGSPQLATLNLPELSTVEQQVYITNIPALTALTLPKLAFAGILFSVRTGVELTTLSVPKLVTVDQIVLEANEKLTSVGLTGLVGTIGSLNLSHNGFTTLDGLEGINKINGSLSIDSNASLKNLEGLRNVTGTVGSIGVLGNAQLASLKGVGGISRVTSAIITNNAVLTSTADLTSLATVDDIFLISENALLQSVVLPALASVKTLRIEEPAVTSVALPNLTSVTTTLNLGCPNLASVAAPKLTSTTGEIVIVGNVVPSLNLSSVKNLSSLRLTNDKPPLLVPLLAQLESSNLIEIIDTKQTSVSFTNLTSVGSLQVSSSTTMTTLSMPKLTSATSLVVTLNGALTTLSPTPLNAVTSTFTISANVGLETCMAKALRAQLTTFPTTTIVDNKNPNMVCP